MSIQVFISHSSGVSTKFAKALYQWITDTPLGFTPWASFEDLQQGSADHERIRDAAKLSQLCVCVIEPGNTNNPWINFEAGLFFNRGNPIDSDAIYTRCVYTMLIGGLDHKDLSYQGHPLGRIYHCYPNNTDSLEKFLRTIFMNHSESERLLALPKSKGESIHRYIANGATKKLIKAVPSITVVP
jgi:TIR domain